MHNLIANIAAKGGLAGIYVEPKTGANTAPHTTLTPPRSPVPYACIALFSSACGRGWFGTDWLAKYMSASLKHHAAGMAIVEVRLSVALAEQRAGAWLQNIFDPLRPPLEPDHPTILALPEHEKCVGFIRWATESLR